MTPSSDDDFWQVAEQYLQRPGVSRSTMMGYPCLRLNGDFFASWDGARRAVVAKLDAPTVESMVDAGDAESFSPNGRRFREWVSVPDRGQWDEVLDLAFEFAVRRTSSCAARPRHRRTPPRHHAP